MQSNFDRFLAHVGCYGQTTKRAMDVTMCRAPHRLYLGNKHSAKWVAKKIQLKPTAKGKKLWKTVLLGEHVFLTLQGYGLFSWANMLLVSGSVTWKKFLGGNQHFNGISVKKAVCSFRSGKSSKVWVHRWREITEKVSGIMEGYLLPLEADTISKPSTGFGLSHGLTTKYHLHVDDDKNRSFVQSNHFKSMLERV